jgi:AraC-like DNA-binding protein
MSSCNRRYAFRAGRGLKIRVTTVGGVTSGPQPVERDSRGILDPWLLRQRVRLTRYPAGPALAGLVDRFWAVRWELPDGAVHVQQVLTHPGANLSVGAPDGEPAAGTAGSIEARLSGVARGLTTRTLTGRGWAVAAMTTPGGLGAFVTGSAAAFTDRVVALGEAVDVDEPALLRRVAEAPDEPARVAVLAETLERAVEHRRVAAARQVAGVARTAEADRSVQRLQQLCDRSGIGPRALQRMFLSEAGVSPTWVVRRYRLLDVAEAVRSGQRVSWAQTAAELGYADQAHLSREFRAATGQTPSEYARSQQPKAQRDDFFPLSGNKSSR